ncbi:MAG: hypothetical protein ACI4OT_05365 [Bacilli bacterium]
MNYNVLERIRKNNLKNALLSLIYVLIFNIPLILFICALFTQSIESSMIFVVIIFGLFAIPIDISFYNIVKLVIFPEKSDIFKKYGSVEKIQGILNEINNTKIYEDKHLIISENYICDTEDLEKIVKCVDVLGVHKLVHKTNFVIDYYKIIITDKYGHETSYVYKSSEEKLCNKLLSLIGSKCKNAELGYTKDEWDHINNNKIDLPETDSNSSYDYKCPECNCFIDYGDKFCKNCSCKLDWDEEQDTDEFKATFKSTEQKQIERKQTIEKHRKNSNIWKCIGIGFLSFISSEMLLMILLGDSIEGNLALLLVLIVTIPFFALYYYLFIKRKK